MKKHYLKVVLTLLAFLVITFMGCSKPGESPTTGGNNGGPNRRIQIENITPSIIPSVARESFDVTVKGSDLYQGIYVHLEIKSHASGSCTAFADSSLFITSVQPAGTIKVRTDSLSSCISQNSVFRVLVWFRDTLNILRRDSVYYQWGNSPTTGNTLNANVEQWRMAYVSSALADTMGKCIIRSFNPGPNVSDSNFIKCTVNFDNIQTASDSNFLVGNNNYDYLATMCNSWSQNHYLNSTHNKIIYAKYTDVNPRQAGLSRTGSLGYPVNGTDNWSFIFYKNIDSIFTPSGTVNDTTYGNLTAVHEMMHQLANSHNDRGHKYHYGYFAYKCALWDDDNHFTSELINHKYTNKFRICINHTMQLRSFRQVIPLDYAGGNVRYDQFVAPNPLINANKDNNEDKYTITLVLPKHEYKKYEPVIAKVTLVNNDSMPLNIHNIHEAYSSEPHFTIKDQLGNVYDSRSLVADLIDAYSTEIPPGDSLVFSMAMNNWGKPTSYEFNNSMDEVYFSQFRYFPEGEYTARFDCSPLRNEERIYSNDVVFKVNDLTNEDTEVLRLFKEQNYDEVLLRYPTSIYSEYVLRWKMLPFTSRITPNTERDYNDFIQKYPMSMYLYDYGFMMPYLKSAEQKKDSFEGGINYLLSLQSQESLAKQSLSNNPFTTIIKNYGKFVKNK